ncbi:hypothetical protein Clacol_002327 [Clathrus columnatus]|uniref:Protein kinase domain-containing protein n=1 Tax=Clathrus columnatus TaxID=1419009 RepID=A0AAV5A4E6_9AGAM|nr:hypothetical protein Clacol_002327 [Clathrus columnatus]
MVLGNLLTLPEYPSVTLAEKLNHSPIVHIIVTATVIATTQGEEFKKEDDLPESKCFRQAVKAKSPSGGARSTNYACNQNIEEQTIYNGYYMHENINTLAPPIEIYHPIFNTFFHLVENPPKPTDDDLNNTHEFMYFLSQLSQEKEPFHNKQVLSKLHDILDADILTEQNKDQTKPDSTLHIQVGKECIPILIVELEKELGSGTCDPSIQAGLSMKHTWSLDDVKNIHEKCCCPTFLLSGGGLWLGILGAVFADKDKATPSCEQLEKILLKLHGEGYAFGDLRSQNVLVGTDGNVKLIDFDWCGEYDPSLLSDYVQDKLSKAGKLKRRAINTGGRYAYYPSSVSNLPEWSSDVGPLKLILPDHDWELLYKLFLAITLFQCYA